MKELPACGRADLSVAVPDVPVLVMDAETGSDVNIKHYGQHVYWADPNTRCFMMGYGWLESWGTPMTAEVLDFESQVGTVFPNEIIEAINAPPSECRLAAANCAFDRAAMASLGFPTPQEKWIDILALAYSLGFSGRLDDVLKQAPIGHRKNPLGSKCISQFSSYRKAWYEDADLWDKFLEYCKADVVGEANLMSWCLTHINAEDFERTDRQELIYRKINARGLPVGMDVVNGARKIRDEEVEYRMGILKDVTGLDNPNSRDQFLKWVQSQGSEMQNLQKETVEGEVAYLQACKERGDPGMEKFDDLLLAMQNRLYVNKASVKKYDALHRVTMGDNRLRGGWQFAGASRTMRVAGRTLNPANLARPLLKHPGVAAEIVATGDRDLVKAVYPEMSVMDVLSSCIRASLRAPEGKKWVVSDLTSIESVGAAWVAGCDTVLDLFKEGKDTYTEHARMRLEVEYDEITKSQRTFEKPVVLGGAYALSGPTLVEYAAGMKVDMTLEDADDQIAFFRSWLHEVPHYWNQLKQAAIKAVENPGCHFHAFAVDEVIGERRARSGKLFKVYSYKDWPRVEYFFDGTFLQCMLPSGRRLWYYQPEIRNVTVTPKDPKKDPFKTKALLYWGNDQAKSGASWDLISTHGGKLLENIVQALCRDVLWHALEQAERDEILEVVGDVYDELLNLADASRAAEALKRLDKYLRSKASWLDDDFFLGSDGYIDDCYRKG